MTEPKTSVGRGILVAVCVLAGACGPLGPAVSEARLQRSGEFMLLPDLDVPPVPGVAGCGAQALAAALAVGAGPDAAATLAGTLPWQNVGATPVELLVEARRRGADARLARGTWAMLRDAVEGGGVPIIMIDAGHRVPTVLGDAPLPPVMHWAVVSGVGRDGRRALLGAPNRRHHVIARDRLQRRWDASDRCLIVVRPPNR